MKKDHPKILFLSLTDNDGMNGPISGLAKAGCDCAVMSPPGFTCAKSRFLTRHFRLPRNRGVWLGLLGVRPGLERAMCEWRPDLVAPLDDVSAWLLRGLAASRSVSADLGVLLEASLGSPAGYGAACSRVQFLELASRIGVRAPKSQAATRTTALEAADSVGYPVVLKLEHSCAGFGVTIADGPAQLRAAIVVAGFGRWRSLMHYWALLRRGKEAARRLLWRLIGLPTIARTAFEVQQYIPGASALHVVAAWRGRVLAGASYERLCVNRPPIGNTTVMRYIDHAEMAATAQRVVAELDYSGFALLDYIIHKETGHAYVIEMNPRTAACAHLGRLFGSDACGAMARRLGMPEGTAEATVPPVEGTIVRFPRELERDPESAWLRPGSDVHHDVPWDDPRVFDLYYRRLLKRHPAHAARFAGLLGVPAPEPEVSHVDRFRQRLRRLIGA